MYLIIGSSAYKYLDAYQMVIDRIRCRGSDAVVYRQDQCLDSDYLTFEVRNGRAEFFITIDGNSYNVNEFEGYWLDHPTLPPVLERYNPPEHRRFIDKQFFTVREGLRYLLRGKRWLNDPEKMAMINNKIFQMTIALDAGFLIPETLITSDPRKITELANSCDGKIVTKILAPSPILDQIILTRILSDEQLRNIDSARFCPAIYQPYVEKDYELRITVVGEKIFTAKIESQTDERTKVDWRARPSLNDTEAKMEILPTPIFLEEKIRRLMALSGLNYGAIDMIVTPKGEYVFLEINPNGQWFFVQLQSEAEIADALAELLVSV